MAVKTPQLTWSELLVEVQKVSPAKALSKKDLDATARSLFNTIGNALKAGKKVKIVDFGIFIKSVRNARKGRNPRTGEIIDIPAKSRIRFRPAKDLKLAVEGPKKK